MRVYDVLYGEFELPPFLTELLTTPEFKRLTEIRLININSPALSALADVRRYSHSLGVLRLAMENTFVNFGKEDFRALLASIIVHDAGTPAFAHLFEYQLNDRYGWHHERVVGKIMKKEHHIDARLHQFFLTRTPVFREACKKAGVDFDIVLQIIEGNHSLSKLVFGSIDFDNLDNVARMNWMLGRHFDLRIILEIASSLGADGRNRPLLPLKQRANIDRWSQLRRRAYEIIVFDAPTVAGQAVLSQLIDEALRNKTLSVDDWNYTDSQLLDVLRSSSSDAKERLHRDFSGALPQLHLIAQIDDLRHPLFGYDRANIAALIREFLIRSKVNRPYGYCLLDKGLFEKHVVAIDPHSGEEWSSGTQSNSLILYGFGGGSRRSAPAEAGKAFLEWCVQKAC